MRGLVSGPALLPPPGPGWLTFRAKSPIFCDGSAGPDRRGLGRYAAVTIGSMTFGPARPDLMPGADNAVGTCLAIQSGERVALVADEPSREVAASLEQALRDSGARIDAVLIEAVAQRPIRVAPPRVLEAL